MAVKRKDFQKAVAFIQDFLLKLTADQECAELRDSLNLVLLQMQKYYRLIRVSNQKKTNTEKDVRKSMPHGLRPVTPYQEAHDRFTWKWLHLENPKTAPKMVTLPLDARDSLSLPLMLQAVQEGDMELIKQLVAKDSESVNTEDSVGRTAISYAVHFKQLECLKYLLSHKADVNRLANDGSTAVHRTVHDNYIPALEILIQYNADITIQDAQGRTPTHWATIVSDVTCLETLLKCNVNVNVRDSDGLTPSMWACHMDHKDHFELINSASNQVIEEADGIERDFTGKTWVHWAVRRKEPLHCLRSLLTLETAAIKDDEGKTVIHTAAELGSIDATRLILGIIGHDAINDLDDNNRTCLHLATIGGHGELVNFLLEQGADQFIRDSTNALPFDYAQNRRLNYCTMVLAAYQRQHERKLKRSMAVDGDDQEQSSTLASYSGSSPSPPAGPPRPPSFGKRRSSGGNMSQAKRGPSAPRVNYENGEHVGHRTDNRMDYEADEEEEEQEPMENTREMVMKEYEHHMRNDDENDRDNDEVFGGHRTATGEIVHSMDGMEITEDMRPTQENPNVNVYDETGQVVEMHEDDRGIRPRVDSFGSDGSEKSLSVGMSVSDLEGEMDAQEDDANQRPHKPILMQNATPRSPPQHQKIPPRPPAPPPAMMYAPRPPPPGQNANLGPTPGMTPGQVQGPMPGAVTGRTPPAPHYSNTIPQQHSPEHQEHQYYNDNQGTQDNSPERTSLGSSGGGQQMSPLGSSGGGQQMSPLGSSIGSGQHMPPHGHGEMQPTLHNVPRQLAPITTSTGKKKKKKRKHHNTEQQQPAKGAPTAPLEPVQGHGIRPNGPISPHSQQQQNQFQGPSENQPRVTSKGTAWEVAWEPVRPQNPVPPTTPRDEEREFQFPQQQQPQQPPPQPQPMPRGKKGNKLQGMDRDLVQMESTNVNGFMEEAEEDEVNEPVEQRRSIGRAVIEGPKQQVGTQYHRPNQQGKALTNGQDMPGIRRDTKGMAGHPRPRSHYPPHPQRYRAGGNHPVPAPRPPRNSTH